MPRERKPSGGEFEIPTTRTERVRQLCRLVAWGADLGDGKQRELCREWCVAQVDLEDELAEAREHVAALVDPDVVLREGHAALRRLARIGEETQHVAAAVAAWKLRFQVAGLLKRAGGEAPEKLDDAALLEKGREALAAMERLRLPVKKDG